MGRRALTAPARLSSLQSVQAVSIPRYNRGNGGCIESIKAFSVCWTERVWVREDCLALIIRRSSQAYSKDLR
jgi:hypothetical protein